MRRSALVLGAISLAGCVGYRAGEFRDVHGPFPEQHATVGCLDIAAAHGYDSEAEGPVVALAFGNRCDGEITVDLGAIAVEAIGADGTRWRGAFRDPRGEIRPLGLDGRASGRELLELALPAGAVPGRVCLDVGAVVATAQRPVRVPLCLATEVHS